jgi:hypothetical protein
MQKPDCTPKWPTSFLQRHQVLFAKVLVNGAMEMKETSICLQRKEMITQNF